ncbi:retrovirus-related pol polyprotein from transposon TNT 1-94 [Tanacetum coccineum]
MVVAIVKSCYPNALGDLNVTLKDLSGTVPGTIRYKVLDVGSYGKDITVGAAMILANASVFTPKPSEHYLNITKRNVVESCTLYWRFIKVVHCSGGLSFLTAVCPIRQRFLKTNSHSDLGNKPLPISFLGSGLAVCLHSGLPFQQRIRLYYKGKDHGEYILQSIDEGPFKMGRCRDEIATGTDGPYLGPERDRVVADLSHAEKDRLRGNIRVTNILLQGLPRDIYKLINHNTDAKDIWDNVKMLLEGSELTKDDRESQLYDEFEHFGQHKESNHDQLYAYLKQHESHANENKMLMERLNQHSHDPLTLVSNVLPYQYPSSSLVPPQPSYTPPVTYQPWFTYNTQLDTVDLDEEKLLFLAGGQTNTFDDEVYEGPVQDMAQNEDNIFQADQCDAFDSDVDEAPIAQTMFIDNLS